MKQVFISSVAFIFVAAVAPAQTLAVFDWTFTAQDSGGAIYTFNGLLTGYDGNVTVGDRFDITQANGIWSGTPDGALYFQLDSYAGGSYLDYPPGASTSIPPQLYLFAGNGTLVVNGSSGTYNQPFGSGSFTEVNSNLTMIASNAPWEPSDTVVLTGAALFGWQQYRRLRSRRRGSS
ncbi:MAG TPA: hypothetical protein VHZ07_22170 [Bryobacteraceae bacterium]|jgi:hypothetical protein|nr:hypothetical protein [Bryobacteraceae bacterium]